MKQILKRISSVLVFCILFSLLFSCQIFAEDFISKERKNSTIDHIQDLKDSIGLEKSSTLDKREKKQTTKEKNKDVKKSVEFSKIESTPQKTEIEKVGNEVNVKYTGTSKKELYPSEEPKGDTKLTVLNSYHPEHEGMKIPYYKDREGLKIHPWIGIRGEYKQDDQIVGIESLIMEAKEMSQSTDSELRDYVSTNDKHYSREELILHYKERWPKFTFIHHNDRTTRVYEAKKLWPSNANEVYYDNYDRKFYKLEYTIPNLPQIGYLKLTGRYGSERGIRPNDQEAYCDSDSYLLGVEFLTVNAIRLRTDFLYYEGDYSRNPSVNGFEERHIWMELEKWFPRYYLRIVPHFEWEEEENLPIEGQNRWINHKTGVRVEKEINGNLEFKTDWTHINYARDKNREASDYEHISTKSLKIENDIIYEIIKDLKFTLGLDYAGAMDDFNGFNNYTVSGELMYRKPGLADWRIGVRHTEYYNINDELDTVYFKIGLFM